MHYVQDLEEKKGLVPLSRVGACSVSFLRPEEAGLPRGSHVEAAGVPMSHLPSQLQGLRLPRIWVADSANKLSLRLRSVSV